MFRTNEDKFRAEQVAAAVTTQAELLRVAAETIADWRTELLLGIIDDGDKEQLTEWMGYIREVKAIDPQQENIAWPPVPA